MDSTEIFLRGVWKAIPDEEKIDWIDTIASTPGDDGPCGDYGPIIKEMLEKGIAESTIARFAKIVGYETAFTICYHLSDSYASYQDFPEVERPIAWGLETIDDETGEPVDDEEAITCPHEQLLMLDPSGREMRPRS